MMRHKIDLRLLRHTSVCDAVGSFRSLASSNSSEPVVAVNHQLRKHHGFVKLILLGAS